MSTPRVQEVLRLTDRRESLASLVLLDRLLTAIEDQPKPTPAPEPINLEPVTGLLSEILAELQKPQPSLFQRLFGKGK